MACLEFGKLHPIIQLLVLFGRRIEKKLDTYWYYSDKLCENRRHDYPKMHILFAITYRIWILNPNISWFSMNFQTGALFLRGIDFVCAPTTTFKSWMCFGSQKVHVVATRKDPLSSSICNWITARIYLRSGTHLPPPLTRAAGGMHGVW